MENKKARVIAYYLPQFHPIPENDEWWGKGFTEWTNVAKAKPLFKGHYQPKIPADLGFYDLRMPEIREAQAQLAREAGIEGFCYWHYWFGEGKQLLEKPFKEVLETGKPDFPFCLGWANEDWTNKSWDNVKKFTKSKVLVKQMYSDADYENHFMYVLKAFKDKRYIKVDNKPLFVIFRPQNIPDVKSFIDLWQRLALKNGLDGIYFVGISSNLRGFNLENGKKKYALTKVSNSATTYYNEILDMGFSAVNSRGTFRAEMMARGMILKTIEKIMQIVFKVNKLNVYPFKNIIPHLFVPEDKWLNVHPTLLPNWDRSARSGKFATIYSNSTPELFAKHLDDALNIVSQKDYEHRILFLQSWNEWAEGNFVEPDLKFGRKYIDVLKSKLLQ
ncbi:MAG: glycoside hydrolase family 99-like domain-containing protein [Bacteroidales bacterium]